MPIKIHELAAKEFDEAIEWYELSQTALVSDSKNL